jgi:hypothetical protein
MCELASAVQIGHVGHQVAFGFSGYHAEFHEGYQKHTNPLNCSNSSYNIYGYNADFHKGHGTVGNGSGAAWYV